MRPRLPTCPTRVALWSRPLKVIAASVFILAFLALPAAAQIGGSGWKPYTVTFKIQWPYLTNEASRYFSTNEPLPTYHCLVYSNDSTFQAGSTTLPRTEQRFEPDYTNGEIQYQAYEMIPGNENSYCCFQIHTGDAQSAQFGSTTFMLFVFTNNNGSVREYSGTQLATNLAGKWFQLNVDHNLTTHVIRVWINTNLVWTQPDNGATDFYFKDGVYEQSHNPSFQMDTYITNILMWVSSGTNPPVPPRFHSISTAGKSYVFTGSNGVPYQTYYALCSTNLSLTTTSWTVIATNNFDGSGNFSFTNTPGPNAPQTFYLIKE
jgi:hypothetical protein